MNVKFSSCSCGVNKMNSGKRCAPNPFYATRCKCYLKSQPCNSSCHCKDCGNPCGVRPPQQQLGKRKRRPHSLQQAIPSSKLFAVDRGETLSAAIWSDFESIVLDEICKRSQEDFNVEKMYNDIVGYSKSTFCTVPLNEDIVFREKNNAQIVSKIKHMSNTTEV